MYGDWERVAGECLAILRWAAVRHPDDRELSDVVGELAATGRRSAPAGRRAGYGRALARMRDRSRASGLESLLCVAA